MMRSRIVRRVASLVDRAMLPGGPNVVRFEAAARRAGIYFARIDVDGKVSTRKVVVVP